LEFLPPLAYTRQIRSLLRARAPVVPLEAGEWAVFHISILPEASLKSTMMSCPLLIRSMLERAGTLFPAVEIVSVKPDGSRARHTMRDLHRRARQLSAALQHAGIAPGDRVATIMWNQHEHLETYFGVPAIGAVIHTLNFRLHPDDIAFIIHHARDRFLIVDSTLLDVFEQLRSRVQFERVFVVDHSSAALPAGTESYEAFLASATHDPTYPNLAEDDAAAMCYTSGTTGAPKGVVYSHRSIALHALAISLPDQLSFSRNATVLPISSMFHVNAWGVPFAAVMNGSKLVLAGRNLQPTALLDLIQQEQVTLAAAVPSILQALLNTIDDHPGRWRFADELRIAVGGAAAPESMFRRFDKLGIQLLHAWGLTETSPVATACTLKSPMRDWPADELYAQRARQGLALPFIDVRIVGDQGEAPWDGETTGEVHVRGPWVASGYYGGVQPERWTTDGWFQTGDVATIDAEGYVKITDRLKDLIKSGGEWISSVDLENALVAHESIREAAVPHPKWQERPLAIVVPRNGAIDPAELRAFLERRFARWQVPDDFVCVKELPYTATGKLLKSKLRQDFAAWQWDRP
jgi:fatty-acyl-CoA synthase